MPDEVDPSGEQQPNANPSAREILAWLLTCFGGDGTPLLRNTVGEIKATNLVPIGYAPLLFCGTPGNPHAWPRDGEKLRRCLVRWVEEIATAIQDDELTARHPDSWMLARNGEPITPDWLLSWSDLDNWSYSKHGLSIGGAPSEIEKNASGRPKPSTAPSTKPLGTTERTSLLVIIAALCKQHIEIDHQAHGAATTIAKMTDTIGSPVSPDVLQKILPLIPDALQRRER